MMVISPPGELPRGQRSHEKHWEQSQTSSLICFQKVSTSSRQTVWVILRGLKS